MWSRLRDVTSFFPDPKLGVKTTYAGADIEYFAEVPTRYVRKLYLAIEENSNAPQITIDSAGFLRDSILEKMLCGNYAGRYTVTKLDNNNFTRLLMEPSNDVELQQIENFFLKINAAEKFELFTRQLITEVKNLVHYIWTNDHFVPGFTHLIPLSSFLTNREPPEELVLVLSGSKVIYYPEEDYKERIKQLIQFLKKRLAKYENPNQRTKYGMPLAYYVHYSPEALEILWEYGANFNFRGGMEYFSVKEYLLKGGKFDILQLIDALENKPERLPITTKVEQTSFYLTESKFKLSNGVEIHTKYKAAHKLEPDEWRALFELYKQAFSAAPGMSEKKLQKSFLEEVWKKNQVINLIYARGELIGFNLYQIVPPNAALDCITIYSKYAFMKEEYQKTKLMPILDFRFAYGLQLLFPHTRINFFGLVGSQQGYNVMAKSDEHHFPKYIPEGSQEYVEALLNEIEPDCEFHYEKDGPKNYVVDTIGVTAPAVESDEHSFFKEHILGGKPKNGEIRSGACFYVVGARSLLNLMGLAERLDVDLIEQIVWMSRSLLLLMKRESHSLQPQRGVFANSSSAFWFNIRVPDSNKQIEEAEEKIERRKAKY